MVFEVLQKRDAADFCGVYQMDAADIRIQNVLDRPISFQELKRNLSLTGLPGLSRNMQRRSFHLEEPYLTEVLSMFGAQSEQHAE